MISPEAVAGLAERGWPVFPVEPNGKRPCIQNWEQRASADPAHVVSAWRDRYAGCNVGVACRRALVVVDLDCHAELPENWQQIPGLTDGRDVFAQLLEWAGQTWPATAWTRTPSGGWHVWFSAPSDLELRNTAGLLGPAIDTRASGGYVLAPPSAIDGKSYVWLDQRPPVPLPAWLCRRLAPRERSAPPPPPGRSSAVGAGQIRGLVELVRAGQPGDRNGRLFWAACRLGQLRGSDQAVHEGEEALVQAALEAGLRGGEPEARRTVASGLRTGGAR